MNSTYNKELGSSIKNSNKEFVKEQYRLDHKKNASKVSLYYAHGQTEKNENNFKSTKQDSKASEELDNKAVKAYNLSENVLIAAKQSLIDSGSATSNVSSAAANMQIAANAINKLASDVAALNSIAKNANYESPIQEHTEKANEKIQKAAREAEEVSLDSMQATIEAAQATASTVVTNSQAALESVKTLQMATASNYSNLAQEAVTDKVNLTTAQKNEKLASANFDVSSKQDSAIKSTRKIINKVSNHDLKLADSVLWQAKHPIPDMKIPHGISEGDSYSILWNSFKEEKKKEIKSYRLIMVKHDDSEAFDINIAHDLDRGTYYSVKPSDTDNHHYHRTFYLLDADLKVLPTGEMDPLTLEGLVDGEIRKEFKDFAHVRNYISVDYKGKPIERGVYYVAYVYAVYDEKKQKSLDSTVGYLSLPSEKLILQSPLYRTVQPKVHAPYFNSRNVGVSLTIPIKRYDPDFIDYRVMLVESKNVVANQINKQIRAAVKNLEKAEFTYNAEVNTLRNLTSEYNALGLEETNLENRIRTYNPEEEEMSLKDLQNLLKKVSDQRNRLQDSIYGEKDSNGERNGGQTKVVANAKIAYDAAKKWEAKQSSYKTSDFIFDKDLMATVAAADYKTVSPIKWDFNSALDQLLEDIGTNLTLRLKLTDLAKFISGNKQEGNKLNDEYNKALEAVRLAQAKVDTIEAGLDREANAEKRAEKKKEALKELIGEILVEISEDGLAKAVQELKLKQEFLNEAEKNLQVYEALQDEQHEGLSSMVNDYVQSNFQANKSGDIFLMLLGGDLIAWEESLKAKGFAKKGNAFEAIEPIEPSERKITPPSDVIIYTEMGEDATDNYGEPLFMNQKNYLDQAVGQFKEALAKSSSDQKISDAIDKLNMGDILEEFGRDRHGDISYDATIFSTLATDYLQDAEEYVTAHSPYSEPVTLYQVTI